MLLAPRARKDALRSTAGRAACCPVLVPHLLAPQACASLACGSRNAGLTLTGASGEREEGGTGLGELKSLPCGRDRPAPACGVHWARRSWQPTCCRSQHQYQGCQEWNKMQGCASPSMQEIDICQGNSGTVRPFIQRRAVLAWNCAGQKTTITTGDHALSMQVCFWRHEDNCDLAAGTCTSRSPSPACAPSSCANTV